MHLVELSRRSSVIVRVQRARKNGFPFWNKLRTRARPNKIEIAFEAYGQLSQVRVRPMTAISAINTMHDDVCRIAEEKRVAMIVLPFHKRQGSVDGEMESVGPAWRLVNERILKEAGCSVAILVDRGLGGWAQVSPPSVEHRVLVVFFGGPDDREVLMLVGRMVEHPGIKVKIVRFVAGKFWPLSGEPHVENGSGFPTDILDWQQEKGLDDLAMSTFRTKSGGEEDYEEREVTKTCVDSVLEVATSSSYGLIVVGRWQFPTAVAALDLAKRETESPELGAIGDALAAPGHRISASVLVVQQHGTSLAVEAFLAKGATPSLSSPPSHV